MDQSLLGNRRSQDLHAHNYTDTQDCIDFEAIVCIYRYSLDEDVSVFPLGVHELR